jgi:hypothetical protein
MNAIPMDAARWQSGLSLDKFVAAMKTYHPEMARRLREVTLAQANREFFAKLDAPIHVLVMTEDWCGDSLMNLPILARIVEASSRMDLQIFVRAESPELKEYYAAQGIKAIPVFTFLDAAFDEEIGTWVERPQAAHARLHEWLAAHSEIDELRRDTTLSDAERRQLPRAKLGAMVIEMETWYADEWQQETVNEIKALLMPVEAFK